MMAWLRRLIGREDPAPPDPTPDIGPFVDSAREMRAHANTQKRAADRSTRALRRDNASRDFAETIAPPIWRQRYGKGHRS